MMAAHPANVAAAVKRPKVVVVHDASALEPFVNGWEELAKHALEPNVFYEPFMFRPALQHFAAGRDLDLVFVSRHDGSIIGFFPLVRSRRYRGLPVAALALWEQEYCPLSTPLVHGQYATECMTAFFDWLENESRAEVIELTNVTGDDAFHHLLINVMNERGSLFFPVSWHTRGYFIPHATSEAYFANALRADGRRKIKAKEKKLKEHGDIEFTELVKEADVDAWVEAFLQVERGGWKGERGTAMAQHPADRAFFTTIVKEAFARGRLMMLALHVDGKPVALKCNFQSGEGSFAFKIAYDEAYSAASPGMLLEVENIRRLHDRSDIRWQDSCANARSRMFAELWPDRRVVQTIVVAANPAAGGLFVALLPLFRWMKDRARTLKGELAEVKSAGVTGALAKLRGRAVSNGGGPKRD